MITDHKQVTMVSYEAWGNHVSVVFKSGNDYYQVVDLRPDFQSIDHEATFQPYSKVKLEEKWEHVTANFDPSVVSQACTRMLISLLLINPDLRFGRFRALWLEDARVASEVEGNTALYRAEALLAETWRSVQSDWKCINQDIAR